MAVCSRCGGQLNSTERFCGNCGFDTQAAAQQTAQQTAVQQAVPQPVYMPPPAQRVGGAVEVGGSGTARAAMGLGIAGGLLGIVWGALGPYLSREFPAYIGWFFGANPYSTGIEPLILLVVGLALGVLAILGASVATKAVWVTRVLLLICGLGGFLLGPSWLVPGALILTGAGLAIAARSNA